MAVANLRRTKMGGSLREEGSPEISSSQISIESWESKPIEPLCDDYPFNHSSHRGRIEYKESSEYTPGREIPVDFEYRDGSNLLIVEMKTDVSSIDSIVREIVDIFPSEISVYYNLHVAEDSLWKFLQQADRVIDIRVLDDGQEISYNEIEGVSTDEVIGEYAIEEAEVGFNYENHQILVRYYQGSLQIETDWEEGREYIIQLFEREVLANN